MRVALSCCEDSAVDSWCVGTLSAPLHNQQLKYQISRREPDADAGEAISSVAMTARWKRRETAPARNSWVMDWKAVGSEGVFDPPWRSAARSK